MGRYIDWEDVIDRYPSLHTLGGADELSSSYIVYAEGAVDGLLGNYYTVPFSNNVMQVKDLAIDFCYWRAGRHKLEDAATVKSDFYTSIKMINEGKVVLVDDDGNLVGGRKAVGPVSTTQSYHSSFGMNTPDEWHIDEDNISDDRDVD